MKTFRQIFLKQWVLAAFCLAAILGVNTSMAQTATFSNAAPITQSSSSGPFDLYPSNIVVSGTGGVISSMSVTLYNVSHTFQADLDVLLVGPLGQAFILMSDVGGSQNFNNVNLTFADGGAFLPTSSVPIPTGTYSPWNWQGGGDPFSAPAPSAPYNEPGPFGAATFASVYGGTSANGTWNLYIMDDAGGDVGQVAGGWSLTLTTVGGCTFGSQFPSSPTTLASNDALTLIAGCSFAGEYSVVTGISSGQTLTFYMEDLGTGAYITLHSGAANGPVIGSGPSPLTITTGSSNDIYAHWALNNACGTDASCHDTYVQCNSCPPSNDLICNALPLTCGQTVNSTTIGSSFDAGLPACGTSISAPGIWYVLNAVPGTGITLSMCGSSYDTKLHAFSSSNGTCTGTLTCIAGNDDFCGLQSQISFNATSVPGNNYFILVSGFSSAVGTFNLTASCTPPTPCTFTTTMGNCGTNESFTLGSTGLWNTAPCGFSVSGEERVYAFTPTVTGNYSVEVVNAAGNDFVTYAWRSGSCSQFGWNCLSSVNATGIVGSIPMVGLTTYYILVDKENFSSFASESQTFRINCAFAPPANDNCTGAASLSCGTPVSGDNTGAQDDVLPASFCLSSGSNFKGVWYKFNTANPGGGVVTISTVGGASWDTYLRVYEGNSCAALTCVTANDDFVGLQSQVTFTAVANQDYYVLLTGWGNSAGNYGPYTISTTCVLCSAPPSGGTISGPASNVCTGFNNYSTSGASGSLQWQVSTNGGLTWNNIAGATSSSLTYEFLNTGTYHLRVYATSAGCGDEQSAPLAVSVSQVGPTISPTASFGSTNISNFTGAFAPANWSFSESPVGTGGSVNTGGAPASIAMTSGNNSLQGSSDFTVTVPSAGTISFDWSYSTFDGPTWDWPVVVINGTPAPGVTSGNPVPSQPAIQGFNFSGSSNQTGSASYAVAAGDMFSLRAFTRDGFAGGCTTTFSNFVFSSGPSGLCPGASVNLDAGASTSGGTVTASNPTVFSTPSSSGVVNPYPSPITISGAGTSISSMSVTIGPISHTWRSDLDIVLIGPGGQGLILMSDVGGSSDLVNAEITFQDGAAAFPTSGNITGTNTYVPYNSGCCDALPGTTPAGPYFDPAPAGTATFASVFGGTNPNGTWKLYIWDQFGGDITTATGGWSLSVTTAGGGPTPVSYLWSSTPPGFSSTSPTPTATPGGNTTYMVAVTGNNGCVSTGTVAVETLVGPDASASSNGPVCDGDDIFLTSVDLNSVFAPPPTNGFQGDFAPANWNLVNNPGSVGGTVNAGGAPSSVSVTSGNNNVAGTTLYTINVATPGTVSFNWSYNTPDGPTWDWPVVYINGTAAAGVTAGNPVPAQPAITGYNFSGGTSQNGTASYVLATAGTFAIGGYTRDGFAGGCTVTFSNFVFTPAAAGTGPYTFDWSGPASFSSSLQNPVVSAAVDGVNEGNYSVVITNGFGCTGTASISVAINALPVPTLASKIDESCYMASDGSIAINSSGASPYLFVLDNTFVDFGPTGSFSGLTAGSSGPPYSKTYSIEVTDANGCTSDPDLQVTIDFVDAIAPTIACPPDITVFNEPGQCYKVVNFATPAFTDNCPNATIARTGGPASGSQFPVGTTQIEYTATDFFGNQTVCTFNVIVIDNEDPVFICQADMQVNADQDSCSAVVNFLPPQVLSDNCPGALVPVVVSGLPSGSSFPVGTTVVLLEVTDAHGNSSQCSFNVTVIDNQGPTISCPPPVVVPNDPGFCHATNVNLGNPVTGDNCAVFGVTNNAPAVFPVGATQVVWQVQDLSGNKEQCQQFVIVQDVENPTISGMPSNITINADSSDCCPAVSWIPPTAADNCPGVTLSSTHNPGDHFCEGTTTVTYTALDAHGNSVSASFTVTIITPPLVVTLTASVYDCGYNVTCNGSSDGSIFSSVSGGCLPYSYLWSTGNNFSTSISGLAAGSYTLVITDANGHVAFATIVLTQPDPLVTSLGPDQSFDFGCSCATLTPVTSGGASCLPYNYFWSTFQTTGTIDVCPGQTQTFTLTIVDENGCTATDDITIIKPPLYQQLDRYVLMGLGDQNDALNNNTFVISGAVGHRKSTGQLTMVNNNLINDWAAAHNMDIGNNNALASIYRNFLTQGNGNFIGTDNTPILQPLTPKVPCFPVFAGGVNVNVPNFATTTLVPGTYNDVSVGNGATLMLAPGVYQFNKLTVDNNAFLIPTGGSPARDVFIYVKNEVSFGNNCTASAGIYAQKELVIGNTTNGTYRGTFFSGLRFDTGSKAFFFLDAYCLSSQPLCAARYAEGDALPENFLNVYPNPNDGNFLVQYNGKPGNDVVRLRVMSVLGEVLYEREVHDFFGEMTQEIDLGTLSPAAYFIQLQNGDEFINKQFVITR